MRLVWNRRYFTFWHLRRTPSYTAANRKRMAEDRATYLSHLERWLNYQANSSSPPLADGVVSAAPETAGTTPRKRVDSFVDFESRKIVRAVIIDHEVNGASTSKHVPDLGKVSRMQIVAPLPSCARENEDERDANGPFERPVEEPGVLQRLKGVFGYRK